jgi:Glu-tRNA(Gln) amidotransferase subunit E-like FAD-binding protein
MAEKKLEKEKNEKILMKSGLEIHQQLDTGKLFCRCPSILRNDNPDWIVRRKLHAVAGEGGKVDAAVKHEHEKDKEFIYEGYKDTNCLIEFDEEPPREIDNEALKIVLQVAILLNCEIIPVTQIMRKTVIDGSNTSGFQRTLLVAKNGWVQTEKGKVGIQTICLEEDAARIIKHEEGKTIYRLDRLGIPLIEITTYPEIFYPEQVKEVALKLGDILRACSVKRGIGTIRQDVNISIPEHPRVEIKGFQDPRMMVKTIELEIERQRKELESKKKIGSLGEVRKANEDGTTSFLRPMPGADRMYPETDLPLLKISHELINEVRNSLPKLREDIRGELKQKGLNDEMIKLVLSSGMIEDFESLLKVYNNSVFVAKVLFLMPKEIASHEKVDESIFTIDIIETILKAVSNKKILEEDVKGVMEKIAKKMPIDEALKVEKKDMGEIEAEIAKIVKEKPGLSIGGYMGLVMAKFKGKVSGKDVSDILNKLVK